MLPNWRTNPFPLLDDLSVGFMKQGTEPSQQRSTPVVEAGYEIINFIAGCYICGHEVGLP